MAKKQTEKTTDNQSPEEVTTAETTDAATTTETIAENTKEESPEATTESPVEEAKPVETITDAAISGENLYFIKGKKVIRKNKHGVERELFNFNSMTPVPASITVEGFYTEKLVFLVDGKLYYLTEQLNLGLLAE